MSDWLTRGIFPRRNIRFAVCQTAGLCAEAIARHGADWLSGWLLSEALTSGCLLSVTLKGQERITLRWMYQGPIGTVMVDVGADQTVRGFPHGLRLMPDVETLKAAVGENGRISATTSLPNRQGTTGITEAPFGEVPADLAYLISMSFQTESALAVGLIIPPEDPIKPHSVMGVLVQSLPGADLEPFAPIRAQVEAPAFTKWLESAHRTLAEVIERIGQGEEATLLGQSKPVYSCLCTREKADSILRMIDVEELRDMLKTDGKAEITCHFCATIYAFNRAQMETLLRESSPGRA